MTLRPPPWFLVCVALAGAPLSPAAPAGAGHMLRQLEAEDWIRRTEAMHYLGTHRVKEATPAIRAIRDDQKEAPWVRGRALVALAAIDGKVDPSQFGTWVAHELPELRSAAAEILEVHGGHSSETWIEILLKDQDAAVRFQAAAAHARRHGAEAWPVIDPLTRDPGIRQTPVAARALAWTGSPPALERLATLAREEDRRSGILRGIRDVPNPALIPFLLEILTLTEEEEMISGAVLSALQNHEWQKVIAGLEAALHSGDESMVRTVAEVMTRLTRAPALGPPLRDALAKAKEVDTIRAGLIALGPSGMEPDRFHKLFTGYLEHEESEIRALAIRCLAHCESTNLYEALHTSLSDKDPEVTRAALGALRRAPVTTAPQGRLVHYLQEPLSSPDEEIRNLAYDLLGHAGSTADFRPAMAALSDLLTGTDDTLRAAAAKALGAIAPLDSIGDVVQAQGYLAKWKVIGTFLNDDKNSGFDKVFPPDEKIDFEATYRAEYVWTLEGQRRNQNEKPLEREVAWTDGLVDKTDGRLVMSAQLPPPGTYAVGFAVADFRVPQEREVTLDIDGDDAFRVWLNGEKIAEKTADFAKHDETEVQESGLVVKLRQGANRLVVKTANHQFKWWVRVRLTDTNRKPIEFATP